MEMSANSSSLILSFCWFLVVVVTTGDGPLVVALFWQNWAHCIWNLFICPRLRDNQFMLKRWEFIPERVDYGMLWALRGVVGVQLRKQIGYSGLADSILIKFISIGIWLAHKILLAPSKSNNYYLMIIFDLA